MPKVSILMGAYNCAETVAKTIESIQNQTYTDWEFIICNDGSTDNSKDVILEYKEKDNRIIFIENDKNHGLPFTLNHCLSIAQGEYCARMDADDLCDSTRLAKQVEFLDNHDEYAFVCTRMKRYDENGFYELNKKASTLAPKEMDLVKGSPFSHASAMIRKSAYDMVNGYRDIPQIMGDEDYDLWFRLYSKKLYGYILDEKLYYFYDGRGASKRRTLKRRMHEAWVRKEGYKMLEIPFIYRIYILKPIILGFIPKRIFNKLRRIKE